MSLPRYPQYKNSGVVWVAEVPAHWDVWKLAHAFSEIGSGTTPKSDNPSFYDDGDIPWLNTGDLNDGALFDCAKRVTPLALSAHSSLKCYANNSLAIAMYGATIGKLAMLRFATTVNQACCVFGQSEQVITVFLFYWFLGFRQQIISLATGGGQPNISQEILRNLRMACPGVEEQTAIAEFLDRETGKIDALIAAQEKLITLLAEKRQATISHAVTRGLNPDAPVKDSGVAWLGEVPVHWRVPPLYLRYSSELGKMLDTSRITGKHLTPYLRNVDVQWDKIAFDELPSMDIESSERDRYTVENGDLLVCEGGEVGRAAVVSGLNEVVGYQKALHRLRAIAADEHPRYMFYTFCWAAKAGIFNAQGQATIAHLTGEQLRKYRFPKPPHCEQQAIASFLDAEMYKLGALKTETERAIALLQERRSALIAAAVTGQIDVRSAVLQQGEQEEALAA
jgi:type I restriction enzyme S subunit